MEQRHLLVVCTVWALLTEVMKVNHVGLTERASVQLHHLFLSKMRQLLCSTCFYLCTLTIWYLLVRKHSENKKHFLKWLIIILLFLVMEALPLMRGLRVSWFLMVLYLLQASDNYGLIGIRSANNTNTGAMQYILFGSVPGEEQLHLKMSGRTIFKCIIGCLMEMLILSLDTVCVEHT